jgi:alkanesulfonate monooxygenase SsuD/methylene tetrahydromethanopterin reductase-like flavin-dependent oxidoreductase (luciferase family)
MALRLGYLLPTRERVMEGAYAMAPLLDLARRADALGFDSLWIGDSVTARPRHDPLTLLAAVSVAAPGREIGTAVLLPALRNPVLLAHQVATIDRLCEGKLILGVGIAADVANIRAEFAACGVPFERRVGTMMEGLRLCRALWSGQPVDWGGRWPLRGMTVGPTPHRAGGPLVWGVGASPAALARIGRHFDGWFPNDADPASYAARLGRIRDEARSAGRAPDAIAGAAYLTVAIDEDAARAEARMDDFMARYYGQPAAVVRARQMSFAGPAAKAAEWLAGYAQAGASHVCLRFAGDPVPQMESIARARAAL